MNKELCIKVGKLNNSMLMHGQKNIERNTQFELNTSIKTVF